MRALWTLLVVAACREPAQEARPHPLDLVPDELRATALVADQAANQLQKRLGSRLLEEMARGGAAGAVEVCRDEAQLLTRAVHDELGIAVGRTSHRLRNPKNAPPPWAAEYVSASSGKKFEEVRPMIFDLGDRIGLLRPIGLQGPCVSCHGPAEVIDPAVRDRIAAAYPDDRATGFALGDLRGWIWVEASKSMTSTITAPGA